MAYDNPDNLTSTDRFHATPYGKLRNSIIAESHADFQLGGSRSNAIPTGGGYKDAHDYIEFELPNVVYGGFVYKVMVEIKTENAATTVTPKLRNITDSTDAVVGSAGTSTAWGTYQSLPFRPGAGKKYRLMFSKSYDAVQAWGIGYIRRTHA